MCGLVGFLNNSALPAEESAALVSTMASTIVRRGPDDAGVWVDGGACVALGHRRLSILDISSTGHQPMVSASGRFVVVFNGEIYNHLELRAELCDITWRGYSDTEILLAGVECWGLEATLKKAVGMFAIALWDRQRRELTLARDRMGEKPLYYGWQGDTFLFGSELKAIKAHPGFRAEVDRDVLPLLLRHGYIPAPYSIYQGIRKLVPGTLLRLACGQAVRSLPEPMPYWSLREAVVAGRAQPFYDDDAQAILELEAQLVEAVNLQRVADVPLGGFLSGGIDSSTVVAVMQAQSTRPVRTFTIGFHEEGYNEANHAKVIAQYLGTDHTELYVAPREAMDVIPMLPILYDEPFADSSQIPTFLISQLARQHVTVALSGDGGDELFGGYRRYLDSARIWEKMQSLPRRLRGTIAHGIRAFSPEILSMLLSPILALRGRRPTRPLRERLCALSEALDCTRSDDFYRLMISQWRAPARIVNNACEPATVLTDQSRWPEIERFEERMMYGDALSYLVDDILVKLDRAAMRVSLETRVPLLDHRVVEFSWRLPLAMKIRNGQGKWILRQLLYKYVPKEMVERPKMGFGVPIDHWLRGPLREWAEELLSEERLQRDGFFLPKPIRQRWRQHLSGQYDWRGSLWAILMFQAWLSEDNAPRRKVG